MQSFFHNLRNVSIFNASSLDLQFARTKTLDPRITFTRASSGTFVGSDGMLKTATTNLCLQSENFTTTWTNFLSTDAANTTIAPNGTLTADTLIPDSGATAGLIRQDFSGATFTDNASISFSIYVKAAGLTSFNIQFYNKANTFYGTQTVNASTGGLSGSGTIASTAVTNVGDGWYRVSMTGVSAGSGATGPNIRLVVSSTGDGTSGIYLWGAQLEQSPTVGEYVPTTSTINSAPRFDHNPTTGESLGLLVEEQRTNSIRNNTMVGAVAGTPGTLPTNWSPVSLSGLTQTIVGTGTESGIAYIDIRIFGTTSSVLFFGIGPEGTTVVAATPNSIWTSTFYVRLMAGSLANITGFKNVLTNFSGTGSALNQFAVTSFTPTSAALLTQRSSCSTTSATFTNATTAFVRSLFQIEANSGASIDITLRIGLPQLEQGAFATSPILTSTAAATRSADVASITGANFSSWYRQDEGTVFAEMDRNIAISTTGTVVSINDNSVNNRLYNFRQDSASALTVISATGGTLDGAPQVALVNTSTRNRVAAAQSLNNLAVVANGGTAVPDTSVAMPTVNQVQIGNVTSISYFNGIIRRLTYWSTRLPNATLQQITQP